MKKSLIFVITLILAPLFVFSASETFEYPEIKFGFDYPVLDLTLDRNNTISLFAKNNNNFADRINITFSGTYDSIVDLKFSDPSCSENICTLSLGPNSSHLLLLEFSPIFVGKGTIQAVAKSELTQLESRASLAINVRSDIAQGIFNAPDLSFISFVIVILIGAILKLFKKKFD
jgi:hypothetical protein